MERTNTHYGGILMTTIFTLGLMSLLLVFLLGNYRSVSEFSLRTRRFYEMKIMTQLFLADYPKLSEQDQQKGEVHYNVGTISYQRKDTDLFINAFSGKYKQTHTEKLQTNKTDTSTSDTENKSTRLEKEKQE